MLDLHCHILPGIDDGAADLAMSMRMARALAADGVTAVACSPHILPGLYHNTGPQIRHAVTALQLAINQADIPLTLFPGADNHIAPDFIGGLRDGRLLTLGDSRYVLVEPPHHTAPARLEDFFFGLIVAGYVPILTHPERLAWISTHYDTIKRLADGGVWMQITAGSLTGSFGRQPRYWAERMLGDGRVHILATDAHDCLQRPPILGRGRQLAAKLVGETEATHMVVTRPQGVIANEPPDKLPTPQSAIGSKEIYNVSAKTPSGGNQGLSRGDDHVADVQQHRFARRLLRLLD